LLERELLMVAPALLVTDRRCGLELDFELACLGLELARLDVERVEILAVGVRQHRRHHPGNVYNASRDCAAVASPYPPRSSSARP
jgi:hypothetical protein